MKKSEGARALRRLPRRRDHYELLVTYLRNAGLLNSARLTMVVALVVIGSVPTVMLYSPMGPHAPMTRGVSIALTCCGLALAAQWSLGWPSRRQSVAFAATATVCIAIATQLQSDPRAALIGCLGFAAIAGYVGFFHTSYHMAMMLGTALLTVLVCAIHVWAAGDPALAMAGGAVLAVALLCMPVSALLLLHLMLTDARRSDADPLTGLYNQRGFVKALDALPAAVDDENAHLMITVVDLDGFKSVNDRHGHVTGDRLLAAVASALQSAGGEDTIVARTGGDEFLMARVISPQDVTASAAAIRRAAGTTPYGVTASVGVSTVPVALMAEVRKRELVETLIDAADAAMYEAKRAGGDSWRYHGDVDGRTGRVTRRT